MKSISYLYIILAAVCWGTTGFFTKTLSAAGFSPVEISFMRSGFSAVLFCAVFAAKDRSMFKIMRFRDIRYFLFTGILCLTFYNLTYTKAVNETSLCVAAVLTYTSPAMVLGLSRIFLKEKITGRKSLAVLTTFVGCLFVAGIFEEAGARISAAGIMYGLLSALSYSAFGIASKIALRKYRSYTINIYTFIFGTLAVLPFINAGGVVTRLNTAGLLPFAACYAVITAGAGYMLYTKGLVNAEASQAAVLTTVEPVTAAVLGFAVFHEALTPFKVIGVCCVLASVIIMRDGEKEPSGE